MWLDFKKYILVVALFCATLSAVAQQAEGLIYNLKQNWVQYDVEAESFMPAISQSVGKVISFQLNGIQFKNQTLYIKNTTKAYFFYENVLLTDLQVGEHFFNIDSLITFTNTSQPLFSIYGNNIKENLSTFIITTKFSAIQGHAEEPHIKNKSYTSFFIFTSIFLLAALIFIKINSQDMFAQYSNVSRVFNLTTIDELIYKGRFFVNPSLQIVTWMSFSAAFALYFTITKLNIHFLGITWVQPTSILFHILHLFILAIGFLSFFAIRYLLISIMAIIFDMSAIKNVHFASHLRLTFYLLIVLQSIITIDYFSIIHINTQLFLFLTFGFLFTIIILIGIRLSFIVRHPFVQIFLYLCGTEIFLFVFVYKLVVG